MTSANDLIQDALEMLGVYSPGDTIAAADSARTLFILNALIDELASQNIFIYQLVTQTVALSIAKSAYTIAPSGTVDITANRPQTITYGQSAASISSPGRGAGYAVNDTGTVSTGSANATYIVNSVAPGGAVSGYSLTNNGTSYTTNASAATAIGGAQPGSGTGFLLSITASSGPITASAFVGSVIGSPVNVLSAIEFQSLAAYTPVPGLPDTLWYNPAYPAGTLNILPSPSAVYNLAFTAWLRITSFPTLTTAYALAVGVLDSLRDSLAVAAKTYFTSAQLDPIIGVRAAASKDFLRYQSIVSRATLNRFVHTANPAKTN